MNTTQTRYVVRECLTVNDMGGRYRVSYHSTRDGECASLKANTLADAIAEFRALAAAYGWDLSDFWSATPGLGWVRL